MSGVIKDPQDKEVAGAGLILHGLDVRAKMETKSSDTGRYEFSVAEPGRYQLEVTAPGFRKFTRPVTLGQKDVVQDLQFSVLSEQLETLTVLDRIVEPQAETRNAEIYTKTLFTRDDQVFQTLNAGISVGQHAGGGKSLEIRRFGFNLDHGGTGGGIRIMVNDVQQNQQSQAHAHGYLGNLKSLSPELVQNVTLINGPFDGQYGDFSTLGVVTIETRDEMPDRVTARLQYGQFNTWRGFGAYSPNWKDSGGLIAVESSYSDGPFVRPLEYVRNNVTGAYYRKLSERDKLTFRFNGGNNHYYAAGQLPVDEVEAGRLDRFGFIDGTDGGESFVGTASGNYTRDGTKNLFRAGGWVQRSLLDLYSNFTFF
ncbi:MAG: TonB-dependent receptor, partial [Bryobacteraceae bacterium]|nr:TonB-dependent receptor [Bryobacteraceae bacterium]